MGRSAAPSTPLTFMGLDPGQSGGIAVICGGAVNCQTRPRTIESLFEYIALFTENPKNVVVGIEQVGGFVNRGGPPCSLCGQQKNRQPGSSMFNFGQGYGEILMALTARGVKVTKAGVGIGQAFLIPPQTWQAGLGIDPRREGEGDSDWKRRLYYNAEIAFPKKRYPNSKLTLRTADALLIAMYVKKLYSGSLTGY